MSNIKINFDRCVGCTFCIQACPLGAINVKNKKAVINNKCNFCGACVSYCKFEAIVLQNNGSDKRGV